MNWWTRLIPQTERGGERPPLVPDASESGGVVRKDPNHQTPQRMTKVVESQTDRVKLPKTDGPGALCRRPEARNKLVVKISTPPLVGDVWPEEKVTVKLLERNPFKMIGEVGPPEKILLIRQGPLYHYQFIHEIPTGAENQP